MVHVHPFFKPKTVKELDTTSDYDNLFKMYDYVIAATDIKYPAPKGREGKIVAQGTEGRILEIEHRSEAEIL